MKTLEQIKHESVGSDRFRAALMGIFSAVALVLAAIGLYGVISYSVLQRTREIGIRSVLGASPANIARLVLGSGLTLTLSGLSLEWALRLASPGSCRQCCSTWAVSTRSRSRRSRASCCSSRWPRAFCLPVGR